MKKNRFPQFSKFISRYFPFVFFFLVLHFGCSNKDTKHTLSKTKSNKNYHFDLKEIKKAGVLKAITTYSPTGYFLYRGQTMGFEYEILSRLAQKIGVELEIVIAKNVDSIIPMLQRGDGDIIAIGFTITNKRKEKVSFTNPYLVTNQTLVQRKPNNWHKMTRDNIKKQLATDIVDLIGDTVSVRKKSSYYNRLVELSNELGDSIHIHILPGELTDEEIIKQVANGEIKYTVIDKNIATIHKSYYPNIDVETPISLSQRIAWAVRKNSPDLLHEINNDLASLKRKPDYNMIYKKYFENSRQFKRRLNSEYFTEITGKISAYDNVVKEYAKEIGWDWRLLKSLIYQESMFNPDNESWTGASGLMQLMPSTAKELGVKNIRDPKENIRAGVKYLKQMYSYWDHIPDTIQRIKFAMASYNSGYAHVKDAQKLAIKNHKDSLSWDNGVDFYLLNLSKPKYYNDPVVKYGYVRGVEPYNYIIDIFNRYTNYKDFVAQ